MYGLNEISTVVLQRRSLRLTKNLKKNHIIKKNDLISLRPCPKNALNPYEKNKILGKKLIKNVSKEEIINWKTGI